MTGGDPVVAVVGPGAVGSVVAAVLASRGLRVYLVGRERGGCRTGRLRVAGLGEATVARCGWGPGARGLRPGVVLYATKAYDLASAVEETLRAGWRPGLVVSLQNGLGGLELLEEAFGAERAAAGVVLFGAYRAGGSVVLAAPGRLLLGCRRPPCSPLLGWLADAFGTGGPVAAEYVGFIEPWRWLKLAVNAAINPVTVLAWAPNRVVAEDPWARGLAEALASEAGRVAGAAGVPLPRDPVEEALRVAEATGANCSSMLQDAAAGRPTEIAYINGAVAAAARRMGGRAPVNEAVEAAVRLVLPWVKGRELPCGPSSG